jgi:hypothetical protein
MDANDTRWLGRTDWLRLIELFATGRISRQELETLKDRLARVRRGPVDRPALRLLRGGGAAPAPARAPRYLTPSTKEVA